MTLILVIIAVVIILGAGWYLFSKKKGAPSGPQDMGEGSDQSGSSFSGESNESQSGGQQ